VHDAKSISGDAADDGLEGDAPAESESSAWAMVEASPDGMLLVDARGVITAANTQAGVLFRANRVDLVGSLIEKLVPDRLRDLHMEYRAGYQADPHVRPMGGRLVLWASRFDDTEFPVEVALSPTAIAGQPMVVATVRDVSERWAAEVHGHAVLHSIDRAHDGVFMFSPDTWRFLYVNQGGSTQLGYSHDEMLTMTPLDVVADLSTERFAQILKPIVSGEVESQVFTVSCRTKSGTDLPVEIAIDFPPAPPGPNRPRMLVAQVRDITDRLVADRDRERQRKWLQGLADVRSHLLADGSLDEALAIICHHAEEIADALGAEVTGAGYDEGDREHSIVVGGDLFGAGMALVVTRGVSQEPFSPEVTAMVESFAQQAGVAVELVRSRGDRQRLELLEDRERIARDLHDLTIQRLFAAGMGLQSTLTMGLPTSAAERIDATVDELDATIRELRSTIFDLNREHAPRSVSSQIREIVVEHHEQLGFEPNVRLAPGIDSIPAAVVEQLLPSLNEMLSNVARHARANESTLDVAIEGDLLTLTLVDNGVGVAVDAARGGGVDNLEVRAQKCSGWFEVVSTSGLTGQADLNGDDGSGGATATWTALV